VTAPSSPADRWRTLAGRVGRWGVVGASGLVVNSVAMALITAAGVPYLLAAALATQVSTTWNFAGSEWWAFAGTGRQGRGRRALAFFVMNNVALAVRGPIIWLLTEVAHVHPAISNVASLLVVMVARFAVADNVIWDRQRQLDTTVGVHVQEL
jgi:putative flippase GtrA